MGWVNTKEDVSHSAREAAGRSGCSGCLVTDQSAKLLACLCEPSSAAAPVVVDLWVGPIDGDGEKAVVVHLVAKDPYGRACHGATHASNMVSRCVTQEHEERRPSPLTLKLERERRVGVCERRGPAREEVVRVAAPSALERDPLVRLLKRRVGQRGPVEGYGRVAQSAPWPGVVARVVRFGVGRTSLPRARRRTRTGRSAVRSSLTFHNLLELRVPR